MQHTNYSSINVLLEPICEPAFRERPQRLTRTRYRAWRDLNPLTSIPSHPSLTSFTTIHVRQASHLPGSCHISPFFESAHFQCTFPHSFRVHTHWGGSKKIALFLPGCVLTIQLGAYKPKMNDKIFYLDVLNLRARDIAKCIVNGRF